MEGVVDLAEEIFHAPIRIGAPKDINGLVDIVKNPIYSTGVGLLLYGVNQHQEKNGEELGQGSQIQIMGKVKDWFQGNF